MLPLQDSLKLNKATIRTYAILDLNFLLVEMYLLIPAKELFPAPVLPQTPTFSPALIWKLRSCRTFSNSGA